MTTIQLRRGTAAQWTASARVLASGEVGVETDTDRFKIGDGVTAWAGLEYFSTQAAAQASAVAASVAQVNEDLQDPETPLSQTLQESTEGVVDDTVPPLIEAAVDAEVTRADATYVTPTTVVPIAQDAAADFLASDPGVATAAAAAVTSEIAGRDLVETTDTRIAQYSGDLAVVWSVVDSNDNASWLAVDATGGLPGHSADAIIDAVVEPVTDAVAAEIGVVDDPLVQQSGYSFVVVDENDNESELSLNDDGTLSDRLVAAIASRLGLDALAPMPPLLNALGDSITGAPQYGVLWSQLLGDALGLDAWNPSVAGEASADIALRSGALAPELTLTGNEIPATTSAVTVTAITPANGWRYLTGINTIGTFPGYLAGIPGALKHDQTTDAWTFTRTTAGSVVPVAAGTRFYSQAGKGRRDGIWTFWAGRNNINLAQVTRDTATMVGFVEGGRYLVLSILTAGDEPSGSGGYNTIASINAALASTYGSRYVDVRRYLIDHGLAAAGITPTTQDNTDIANDTIPTSLRADNVHPNLAGIRVIASLLQTTIETKGWTSR